MHRVLCLGYSVTEQKGYVERADALAAEEGRAIAFLRSGWGAHSLCSVACLIDEILDALPCEFVLLELFTGSVRYFPVAEMRVYLDEILAATARRRLPVAFLNLYQGGVDYDADAVAGLVEEYRRLYTIPRLDIAAVIAMAEPHGGYLLKDGTHVTPAGGELYGTLVYAFMRTWPARLDYAGRFERLPRRFASLPLRTLPGLDCPFALRRNGIPLHFLEIPGGGSARIDLGGRRRLFGVMVAYGPVSGELRFREPDSGRARAMLAYDAFCYYTRSVFLFLGSLKSARHLEIAQDEAVPQEPLRKGEKDTGPRIGRVSHLFFRRDLGLAERAAHLRHRVERRLRLAGRRRGGR